MLSQIVAEELTFVALGPVKRILDHRRVLAGQRVDTFLLTYKEMSAVVVQHVDSRVGPLAVRNQHVGRHLVVARQLNLYLARLITLSLLLVEHGGLVAVSRSRRGCQHAVQHLLSGRLAPFLEVLDRAVAPSQGIVQVGYQQVGIRRQVAHEFIFFAFLSLCCSDRYQQEQYYLRCFFNHNI